MQENAANIREETSNNTTSSEQYQHVRQALVRCVSFLQRLATQIVAGNICFANSYVGFAICQILYNYFPLQDFSTSAFLMTYSGAAIYVQKLFVLCNAVQVCSHMFLILVMNKQNNTKQVIITVIALIASIAAFIATLVCTSQDEYFTYLRTLDKQFYNNLQTDVASRVIVWHIFNVTRIACALIMFILLQFV